MAEKGRQRSFYQIFITNCQLPTAKYTQNHSKAFISSLPRRRFSPNHPRLQKHDCMLDKQLGILKQQPATTLGIDDELRMRSLYCDVQLLSIGTIKLSYTSQSRLTSWGLGRGELGRGGVDLQKGG